MRITPRGIIIIITTTMPRVIVMVESLPATRAGRRRSITDGTITQAVPCQATKNREGGGRSQDRIARGEVNMPVDIANVWGVAEGAVKTRVSRGFGVIGAAALAASVLLPVTAPALDLVGPGVTGNDTGGIIPWSPEIAHIYRDIAADYCARWNRIARITSVHRRYGDFVGFVCLYDRYYDPRKAWWLHWHAG